MKESPQKPSRVPVGHPHGERMTWAVDHQRRAETLLIWALWLVTMLALRPVADWIQEVGQRVPLLGAVLQTGFRAALES